MDENNYEHFFLEKVENNGDKNYENNEQIDHKIIQEDKKTCYKCDTCDKVFSREEHMEMHRVKHKSEQINVEQLAIKKKLLKVFGNITVYRCLMCQKILKTFESFLNHDRYKGPAKLNLMIFNHFNCYKCK